ncbi:MAG: OmpA family protein, partial [Cytophagales bacterium]|nr:OmpA family protein [Cytophaga sp.]
YQAALAVQPNDKRIIDQVPVNIKKCDTAIYFVNHPVAFTSKEMPAVINSFYIHSHPVLTADQQTIIYTKRDGLKISDDEDIVISTKKNGVWSVPVSISDTINTDHNEGACTMSADGKILVFIACPPAGQQGSCDLFISYKKGDSWGAPVNMGHNVNSPAWDSEPTLSADGRTLYFASDRSGGFGKEDIYVTYCDDKMIWSTAKNLGKSINTSGREVSPCIHANAKTLYFSSNNYPGLGGFDIFFSQKKDSTWARPVNIGYPINTYLDDATLFISVDSKKGYYSKYDKGSLNSKSLLYEFDVPLTLQQEESSTYSKGHIYDAVSHAPLAANIELIDLATNNVVQSVYSDPKQGDYTVVLTEGSEYGLYVSAQGYLFESLFFDFKNPLTFNPLTLDVYLKKVSAGASVVLNNIFFTSNSAALADKSKTELQKLIGLMSANPSIRIELSGYTDNVGQQDANLKLSTQRAKSVYDYLISNGVSGSRITYKGYASANPIADNNTEEGRQKNRRLEIKVL